MPTVERLCANKSCRNGAGGGRKKIYPRTADVARGWGQFCSKSCKAVVQERRTGQNAAYQQRVNARSERGDGDHDGAGDWEGGGWDAHKESF